MHVFVCIDHMSTFLKFSYIYINHNYLNIVIYSVDVVNYWVKLNPFAVKMLVINR